MKQNNMKKIIQIISRIKIIPTNLLTQLKYIKLLYKILFFVVIIGSFIAYKMFFGNNHPIDIKVVEVHKASKENLLVTTKLLGTINAKKYYVAIAGITATLEFVSEPGAKLKQGDKIAYLAAREVQDAYNSAFDAAKIAEIQYKRELMLEKSKISSKYSVEQQYMQLAQAQSNLAAAKTNLDKILFTAPFDGIVTTRLFQEGSQVKQGDQIVTLYDDSELVVKFDIPSDIAKNLSDKVLATINGKEYKVSSIQKILAKNSYSVPAYVDFKCDDCMIGEVIEVNLHIVNEQDVITLPSSCVFLKDGQNMVYKVVDGKAQIEKVKVGYNQENISEILEGVNEGDLIIADGQARLYPNIAVKIYNQDKP